MAFRKKKDRILRYDPDVLVVQECENPDTNGEWPDFSDWRWIGADEHKGLGIFTRNGLSLEPTRVDCPGGWFSLPISVDQSVDLLGMWAMNDERCPRRRYIGQVYRTVQQYRDFVGENTVVAGDFNWNVIWDESPKSPLCGDFAETVAILAERGLSSAYHALRNLEFGSEEDSTFYMHKKRDRGYHIDYVFLPDDLLHSVVDLSIGGYDDWIDVSDHVPIVIDLA